MKLLAQPCQQVFCTKKVKKIQQETFLQTWCSVASQVQRCMELRYVHYKRKGFRQHSLVPVRVTRAQTHKVQKMVPALLRREPIGNRWKRQEVCQHSLSSSEDDRSPVPQKQKDGYNNLPAKTKRFVLKENIHQPITISSGSEWNRSPVTSRPVVSSTTPAVNSVLKPNRWEIRQHSLTLARKTGAQNRGIEVGIKSLVQTHSHREQSLHPKTPIYK